VSRFSLRSLPAPRPESITPLRRIRFLAGYKAQDIAAALGKSSSWISIRESGIVPLSKDEARALAKILKVPASALLGEGER
jgi:transcriptional regulator with XRE-family HTH domain